MDDTAAAAVFDAGNLTKKPQYKRNRKVLYSNFELLLTP